MGLGSEKNVSIAVLRIGFIRTKGVFENSRDKRACVPGEKVANTIYLLKYRKNKDIK